MEQRSNYPPVKDAQIMASKEECALAYRNTYDESTEFGSEYQRTTATLSLPNHRTSYKASTTRGRRSNVHGEALCINNRLLLVGRRRRQRVLSTSAGDTLTKVPLVTQQCISFTSD
jgi:hypothetical protein